MAELAFDEARHEYRLDGKPLPSVTQVLSILQDFGAVPAEVLERSAEFGTHVHQAVHLFNEGTLDEDALDPALVPYLSDWKKFLADTAATVQLSELRLADGKLGFAGTLDTVVKMVASPVLIDIKTGQVPRTVGPQLAAYQYLLKSNNYGAIRRRLCVQLTGEGYRLHERKDPADWSVFQSALNIYRWRQK